MKRSWTNEQEQVIDARKCNLLVSAAAGSGKTAVLVERIIRRVLDPADPVSIDRMLVVTFTNAAASEMRERIRDALEQELEKDPENTYLQQQTTLVHQAMIMTIHSFCGEVLRTHFHRIDLDPSFSIADETQTTFMKEEAIKELLEEEHERGDAEFLNFTQTYASGKDDRNIERIIEQFYTYSTAYPDPAKWRHDAANMYEPEENENLDVCVWMRMMLQETRELAEEEILRLKKALDYALMENGPVKYEPELTEHIDLLTRVQNCEGYDEMRLALEQAGCWGRLPGTAKTVDPVLKELAQNLRNAVKDDIKGLLDTLFSGTGDQFAAIMAACAPSVREMVRLTDAFSDKYDALKAEAGVVDFCDLEHFALKILCREEDGVYLPTDAARSYAERFREVMIDEYQDSNLVQETILGSVARPFSRFMVGDVKQSIYRFRLARPELFMEKYDTYGKDDKSRDRLIELDKNFRSRSQVLECTNMIFRQIMGKDLGGIAYNDNAALHPGATYGNADEQEAYMPELLLIREAHEKGEEGYGDEIRQEAICVGRRILNMVGSQPVWDPKKETCRMAGFGDFAILLRTISGWGDTFAQCLNEMGIPALSSSGKGFFDALEVKTLLSYLAVLDNPRQDIALAGALRSPIGNLSDNELAMIRAGVRGTDFYDACMEMMRGGSDTSRKLEQFFETVRMLREESTYTPVHELITRVLECTGYREIVLAMPGGSLRKENLDLLVQRAVDFERTGSKGLFRFLRFVSRLKESGTDMGEASGAGNADSVVRIMSIHKSKGLEYPIVFVCGMGKKMNFMDGAGALTLHPTLGIGCSYLDFETRVKIPVPLHMYLGRKLREDTLAEELRILYVAMTRAKEKLILTGWNNTSKKRAALYRSESGSDKQLLPASIRKTASSFMDLIIPAAAHHATGKVLADTYDLTIPPFHPSEKDGCGMRIHTIDCKGEYTFLEPPVTDERISPEELHALLRADEDRVYDETVAGRMEEIADREAQWKIPKEIIPGKVTVSFLKHQAMEKEVPENTGYTEYWFDAEEDTGTVSSAARGTLYHRILEEMDFAHEQFGSPGFVQMQLEWLVKCGKIHDDDLKAVDPEGLTSFLQSDLARRMHSCALQKKLHRETPFILGKPARELQASWDSDELVLLQGVVDVWFEEEAGIVLLDYKTDKVHGSTDELIDKYSVQLDLYAEALLRLTGRPVIEKLIWSFDRNRIVKL